LTVLAGDEKKREREKIAASRPDVPPHRGGERKEKGKKSGLESLNDLAASPRDRTMVGGKEKERKKKKKRRARPVKRRKPMLISFRDLTE